MKCARCHTDLPESARFCPGCAAPQPLACATCGAAALPDARFCAACGALLIAAKPAPSHAPIAERRQLSVMFCDLVGSASLSAGLDPEDLRELMSRYQHIVAETVQHEGGFVARYMGDGVLVYFGWPRADEADAERAARAGRAVIEAVRAMPMPEGRLAARVGIATGLAVVGDLIGEGAAREQAIIGEAPNLAARLQSVAEPDTVVIDAATHALIGAMFECRSLGALTLKGWHDAVPAWTVEAPAALQSRSEALYAGALTPLIGREDELDLLLRRWRTASAGDGQAVLISGEPGIGKSRLMAELERRVAFEPHELRHYFCSPYQQDTPLHPVTARWEREAGFARGDSPEVRLRKLQAAMGPDTVPEDFSLMADVLNLTAEGRVKLDLSPQRQRERTFALLMKLLVARAEQQPVLMLVEDAHWADASSIELFDQVVRGLSNLHVLLVMSFRPEYRAPWIGQAGVTLITLSRLTQRQSTALAMQVMHDQALPPALLERVVAQTDGVPLFIEELTRTVLERVVPDDAPLAVPATLQASLLARLDRVPATKQVAQIVAVIGREAPRALLAEVAGLPDTTLNDGLEALVASGLAFRRGVPPETTYVFKHVLVQEAAYESLLRSRRADIHGAVASVLAHDPDRSAGAAAAIGHHFAQAGQIERAATWYRRAGERAAERSAIAETKAQLQRGLQLAATLPGSAARNKLEAELHLALGRHQLSHGGNADLDAAVAFEHCAALCRSLDVPDIFVRAMWGRFTVEGHRGRLESGNRIGHELLALSSSDAQIQMVARMMLGVTAVWLGRFEEAKEHLSAVVDAADRHQNTDRQFPIVQPGSFASGFLAIALLALGFVEQATEEADDAIRRTDPSLDSLAAVLSVSCRVAYCAHDHLNLLRWAQHLVDFAEPKGLPFFGASGRAYLAWLTARNGDPKKGLAQLDAALAEFDRLGVIVNRPVFLGLRHDCLVIAGRHSQALATLDNALDIGEQTGEAYFLAEIHRLKGELLLPADAAAGEHELRTALTIARRQEARLWELRAALGLARHLNAAGQHAEVRHLLAPVCNWFAPTVRLQALTEARALLSQVGA